MECAVWRSVAKDIIKNLCQPGTRKGHPSFANFTGFVHVCVGHNVILRVRWILLTVGLLMGCALAFLFVAGPFGLAQGNW